MANKKKIPARALACLLSTAMVPGSLPMDVLTVYGAEAEEFSDGKTSEADITPLDADAVDDAVETADFSSGSEVTADVVSEEASVDVQSADPNFDYTLNETEKTLKVGDTGSVSGTAVLNSNVVVPTAISYASSNPAVVAVDPSTGFYECMAEGIAAITATVKYTDPSSRKTYQTVNTLNITVTKDAEPQLTVTVKQPNVSVELDAKADAIAVYDLKNNVTVENADTTTYTLKDAATGNTAAADAAVVDTTAGVLTFKKAGTYVATVTATGKNSDGTAATKDMQVVFEVTKKTSAAEDFTYEISELQRTHTRGESGSAAGTALLGNQAVMAGVEYSSSDDTVVKLVDNKGAYQCVGAGTATITVTATYDDPDTGKKYQKKVNLAITVKDIEPAKTELIASQTDVSLELDAIDGATAKYNLRSILSVKNGDLSNVTYESSDATNAEVVNGTATFKKAGEYKVRAYIGSSSVTINFHITKKGVPAPIITANQTDVSLELDSADNAEVSYNLKSILSVENGLFANVKYESSDETNAKVELNGTATFKKAGEYTVRAYIESSSVTINFHITKKGVAAPTITANQTDVDIELGATETERVYNLKSILNLTDAEWTDVDIQSSDATNAEINSTDGTVKVKEAGEYTVKATVTTKGGSQSVTVNFHVTREAAAKPAITAKQKEVNITLASGSKTVTYNLKANFTLSNLDWTDVDIQSSDATNAKVNSDGTVTFSKVGYYTVTAVEKTNAATSDVIIFHVTSAVQEAGASISGGQDVPLSEIGDAFDADKTLTVKDFDGTELEHGSAGVVWTSDNKAVATVTDGVIVAVGQGTAVITATLPNGNYTTYTVTVAPAQISTEISTFDVDLNDKNLDPKDYNLSTLLTVKNAKMDDVVYSDFNQNIIQVDHDGLVTFTGKTGTTYVRAQIKNTDAYVIITFNVTDSATPDPITINYAPGALQNIEVKEGQAYEKNLRDFIEVKQGSAFADLTNVTWSSNDDSVAKVDGGVVTGLKPGTAVITATTVDGYYVTFTVKVNPKALANVALKAPGTNVINLTLDSAVNASKDLSELVESTTVPTADVKGFTWSSDNTDVAVAANGTVKAVNPGLAMVTVTAPDGSSVSFIVSVSAGSFDQTTLTPDNLKQIVLQLNVTDKETAALPEIKSDGGVVTWKVLDTDIARIAGNKVEGLKAGHTVAVATAPDGSSVGVSVKVLAEPVVTVKLTGQDEISLKMGQDETHDLTKELTVDLIGGLTAPGLGGSAPAVGTNSLLSQLTWTCSDESVVKVYSGVAVAQSAGVAVVTATAPDGSMAVFTITVDAEDISSVQLKAGESNIVNLILDGSDDESHKDLAKLVEDTVLGADPATFNWVSADKTIATVSHGVVRAQAVGNTTVTVTAPDGSKVVFIVAVSAGGFKPGYEADWEATLQVGVADKMSKKLPTVEATAGKVTWSCADESIAKITGDSVTAVAPGITYVIAKAPNGSELAFKVTVYASPAISFDKDSVSVPTGEVVQANVAVDPEDAAVDYEVKLDGNLAAAGTDYTLSVNGKKISFVPLAAGRFVITATAEVNSETATAQLVVTAQQEVEKVAFTEDKRNLFVGDTDDLLSLIQWNDGLSTPYDTSLTWSTGNASVATVDDTGVVTATGVGRTYVYAKASNGLRAKILVIVDAKVEGVTLSQENYELWVNEIAFIKATPNPANAKYTKVEYTSDDDTIATVSTDGRIVAKKGGTTYITATITWTDADGNNQTASARAKVFVKTPVKSVEVRRVDTDTNDDIVAKKRGETIQLKAVITPAETYDKSLTWSSENEAIATVDQNGKVTTVGKGTTYIYAKCMNGTYGIDGTGKPAVGMIKIIVGAEDDIQLDITPTRSEVYPGENVQYTTTLTPEEAYAGELTWSSDNSDVVIDSTGVAMVSKTAKAGLANITATMTFADGTTEKAKALLYIKTDVNSLKFEKDAMTIYLDEDDYLSPIFNDGATTPSDTSITWTSDDSSIVSVDSYGKIHANKLGTTWISAYSYNKLRAQMLVKVIAAPTGVKLSEEVISGFAGEKHDIGYTFTPDYTTETGVTWSTNNADVAYYDTYTNKIVMKGAGSCWITITANDTHHGVITDKVKVNVRQKVTGVTICAKKLTKKVGNMFKMTATAIPANGVGSTIFWSSSRPQVATVDEFGVVTCLKAGTTMITAITANGHVAKCYLRVKPGKKVYTVKYGVTTASALFVRNSASLQGIQIGQLGRGTAVTIVDTVDEWYKIKFNGGYGYVRAAYVKITSGALTKRTAVKSNGQISTTTWIYTGVGTGANTVAPVATRVLITGETGNYYRVRYGTGSVGSGYVLKSCVRPDAGFKYGVATKTTYLGTGTATKKFSSTPQITVYRVARTTKRTGVYADATGKGKRIGVIQCKAKVVLNSAKINGYYQVVFTNGVTGYVPVKALKLLGAGIKSYVNTTNTYTKAYRK
ncbi:MAG: Ig-like domain-containing protein [Blautia sp.]